MTSKPSGASPASVALMEAVDQAIAGETSYPDRAEFVDADSPALGQTISEAHRDGRAVVLCYADNTRLVIRPASPAAA